MEKDINKKKYSLGDIWISAWNIYKKNFKLFLIISLLIYLPAYIIINLFEEFSSNLIEINIAYTILSVIIVIIIALIGTYIPLIAIMYSVDKTIKNKQLNYQEVIKKGFSKFFPAFGTTILLVIFLIGLFILLIVPGIIFSIYWYFTIYAVVLRDKSGKKALDYSKAVVKKRWWRVLGILLVISLAVGVITLIINGILLAISSHVIIKIISDTLTSIISIFMMVAATIFFINLDKVRVKG